MASPAAVLSILVTAKGVESAVSQLGLVNDAAKKAGDSADMMAAQHKKGAAALSAASKVGVIAIGGLAAAAVKSAADYQSSMNQLQAVSGATGNQMKQLSKLAVKLGADTKLPATSAQDAAEAMTEMIKAGVSVKDTMEGVRSTLVLSAAAGISNAKAAEIASNALNAFKLKGKDVTKVADELANTANASSVEIGDVADSFQMAAAVFAGFQKPVLGAKGALTELNVAIGLLGNAGIKGSDAGTSLKQALLQLTGPSNKSKDAMKALYIAAEDAGASQKLLADVTREGATIRGKDLKALISHNKALGGSADIAYTAAGSMRSLKDIIALVTKGTSKMTQEEKNSYLTQIFGADATRSVIALMEAGPKAWDKMTAAVQKQGAANDLAAAKMKGFNGAVEALKSTLQTLAITFGTVLLPPLTKALQFLSNAAPVLQNNKTLVLALAAAIGALAAGTVALNIAMAVNPFVLAAAAIAALTVVIVKAYQQSATFRSIVQAAFAGVEAAASAVQVAFSAAVQWVTAAMNSIVTDVRKWDVAVGVVKAALTALKILLAPEMLFIVTTVRVAMAEIPIIFRTVWGVVKAIFQGAWTALKGIVEGGLQSIHGVIEVIGGIFKGDFGQIWQGIKDIFGGQLRALIALMKGYVETFKGAASALGKGVVDGLVAGIKSSIAAIGDAANWLKNTIVGAVKSVFKINSPSRIMMPIGAGIAEGLLHGFGGIDVIGFVKDQVGKIGALPGKLFGSKSGTSGKGGVLSQGALRALATQALSITGHLSDANVNALVGRIMQESGGRIKAINLWDSNAKAGHPSKGLAQTIDSTFQAYRDKRLSGDIYDPLANVVAAINYMFAQYGHVVGPSGSGYASGTSGAARGWAWVGERGPELVNFGGGERVFSHSDSMRVASAIGGLAGYAGGTGRLPWGWGSHAKPGPGKGSSSAPVKVGKMAPIQRAAYVTGAKDFAKRMAAALSKGQLPGSAAAGVSADTGSGGDPNQPLIDALNAAAAAETEHTNALNAVKASIDAQTAFATSASNTSNFQLTKSLADLLSGHIVGYGVAGRAFTPGTGVEVNY